MSCFLSEVKVAASYTFVNDLIGEILYRCQADSEKTILKEGVPSTNPSLVSSYVKLDKTLLVEQKIARYSYKKKKKKL